MSGIEHKLLALLPDLQRAIRDAIRDEVAEQLAKARTAGPDDGLISVAAAAARIGMSPSFMRDAIRDGRLPSKRLGRAVRVAIADVDALPSSSSSSSRSPATPRERAGRIRIGGGR